jgi:hypothetical protein
MARVEAWHSPQQNVHHHWDDCPFGSPVAAAGRHAGTAGLPLCADCALLTKAAEVIERTRARTPQMPARPQPLPRPA